MNQEENYTEDELRQQEEDALASLNNLIAQASSNAVGNTMYIDQVEVADSTNVVVSSQPAGLHQSNAIAAEMQLEEEEVELEGGWSDDEPEEEEEADDDEQENEDYIEEMGGNIGKASTPFLQMVERIAEECYPGMWSIEPVKTLTIQGRPTKYLIVHFPELTVRNRDRREHVIRDMYAMFEIGDGITGSSLYGIRRRNSMPEAVSGYAHSHLGHMPRGMCISSFCLGNTSFYENLVELSHTRWTPGDIDWEQRLQSFLFQLETYLSWESLEGGPYRRIAEITMGGDSADNVPLEELKAAFKRFLAFCRQRRWVPPISFDFERGKVELILDDDVENVLAMCTTYHQHISDGTFYSPRTMQLREKQEKYIKGAQEFYFRGRLVPMVVDIPGKVEDEQETNKRKYAHRKIANYVTAEFEKLYRDAWFSSEVPTREERRIAIEFKRENYNQRRISSSGTVLMSAD